MKIKTEKCKRERERDRAVKNLKKRREKWKDGFSIECKLNLIIALFSFDLILNE